MCIWKIGHEIADSWTAGAEELQKSQENSYKTLTKGCLEAVEKNFFHSSRRNVDLSPCFTCE